MKLRDSFDGNTRFEGDRALRWRSIPADARIVSAKVTVTPVDAKLGGPFAEPLSFNGTTGEFGATRTLSGATSAGIWVEADFHHRRTLARVVGSNLKDTTLQVDLGGGAYVEINKAGAFKTPSDPPGSLFQLTGNTAALPGLTVAKLKLTGVPNSFQPDLTTVIIRSVPTNVSLRLGDLPPFWTHLGEMTQPEITPDFTAVLQAALTSAKVENGFYDLPLVLHSDAIARLQVELEVEFLAQVNPLPQGLQEVVLSFDFSTLPQSTAAVLNVAVPPNTRVVPGQTTARVRGAFAETRVAYGPTGAVTPAAAVEVSAACSQAQIVALEKSVSATAVDLLIGAVTPTARLRLDLRGDLDGKPDDNSLLPGPVEFKLDQEAGKAPRWTNVPLPAEFLFAERTKQRYWLVLQSLEGKAAWSVAQAPGAVSMQCNRDGGLSWRDTVASGVSGPVTAFFRLRRRPERFEVPIELQVGDGEQAVRVKLDRFAPLGRVDFALDAELAQAFNQYLSKVAPPACPEGEHLANGEFEQWLVLGDKIGDSFPITLQATTGAVAAGPDGKWAYVGILKDGRAGLQIIDVACDEQGPDIPIKGTTNPQAVVVHPDGTSIYVFTADGSLHLIDTMTRTDLGVPSDDTKFHSPASLAISPDGRQLYVATENNVQAVGTAALERAVRSHVTLSQTSLRSISPPLQANEVPTALAVSPDGSRLYVMIVTGVSAADKGKVLLIDAGTFTYDPNEAIEVGIQPTAIALTPDGKSAVVAGADVNNVASVILIDTATAGVIGQATLGKVAASAVATSPDGMRAFVASDEITASTGVSTGKLSVVDLKRIKVNQTVDVERNPIALAITPQGDRVYVAKAKGPLTVIPVGTRIPAEWSVTSGLVSPACFPDPSPWHLVAVLGRRRGEHFEPNSTVTALSQVVPVAASCPYEFSFWALSSDVNAEAEVFWLGQDCGFLRADQVPIKVWKRPSGAQSRRQAEQKPQLVLHRMRLTAPAGATQAEVRFTAPPGVVAAIDRVSLTATSEAVANGDLQIQQDGLPANWNLSPQTGRAVFSTAGDSGVRVQSVGPDAANLVQAVPMMAEKLYALEFEGRAVPRPSALANPKVELRWLKADGTSAGPPTSLEILPTGFDHYPANGTTPAGTTQVEVHLIVPLGATLEVNQVSLQSREPKSVPVAFIAQAPGELTVSDVRIAFEQVEAPLPPVPDRGLCVPTPPGRRPGETPGDCCFCHHCESEQTMIETKPVVTQADRPALAGRCATCGNELVRPGGPRVPGAQPLSLRRLPVRSPVLHPTTLRVEAAPVPPLTAMAGIGERRARQLAEIGITSIEGLAAAAPEDVARAMKGVSVKNAANFIGRARQILASAPRPRAKAMHPFL
jgi:DNA-binding beta-propeller fold protein YncE